MKSTQSRREVVMEFVVAGLVVFMFFSFITFALASVKVSGIALGTNPATQGYVLEERGEFHPTTPGIWLYSLIHSTCALIISPAILFILSFIQTGHFKWTTRELGPRLFLVVWVVFWFGGLIPKLVTAVRGWLLLH